MYLTREGLKLHYEVTGPDLGPPVLLIHGFPFSGEMWQPMIERLEGELRLINPDLRGLGGSEAGAEATMATYVDDCVALLDHLGESRPVTVMGLSMGGYIAFEFFRRARKRIKALILADTRGTPDSAEAAKGRHATADKVRANGSRIVAEGMIGKVFAGSVAPELRDKWFDVMSRSDPKGVAAALGAMASRPDSTPTYAQIDVPTLIIVGEEDSITPPEDSRIMHEAIRDSRLVIVPRAGHLAPTEQPGPVADAVRAFVKSL
ncbi:MAG: alpha/beta fold hydrolase [Phycisphaerales bacterium]|nr:alpha/beta fold hydrolase [Phycisphaerales bacterium]